MGISISRNTAYAKGVPSISAWTGTHLSGLIINTLSIDVTLNGSVNGVFTLQATNFSNTPLDSPDPSAVWKDISSFTFTNGLTPDGKQGIMMLIDAKCQWYRVIFTPASGGGGAGNFSMAFIGKSQG
jgi:hypothetical protein